MEHETSLKAPQTVDLGVKMWLQVCESIQRRTTVFTAEGKMCLLFTLQLVEVLLFYCKRE